MTIDKRISLKDRSKIYFQNARKHFYGTYDSSKEPFYTIDSIPEWYLFEVPNDGYKYSKKEEKDITVFASLFCWAISKSKIRNK